MPADFAATLHTTYPLSQPPPRGPKPWPGVSGLWQHNTLYAGQSYTSQWSLTPIAGRSYAAQEIGLGNATGTAVLNGNILAINWITSAETGTYQWNLDADFTSGVGTLTFTGGARAGTPNCNRMSSALAQEVCTPPRGRGADGPRRRRAEFPGRYVMQMRPGLPAVGSITTATRSFWNWSST